MARRRKAADDRPFAEDHYKQVSKTLIELIESGAANWTQAWAPGQKILPYNCFTRKTYRGVNSVWLSAIATKNGFQERRWATARQVGLLGGNVRAGAKPTQIVFWSNSIRRLRRDLGGRPVRGKNGLPEYEEIPCKPIFKHAKVYNAEQCTGLPEIEQSAGGHKWEENLDAERLFRTAGANWEHTDDDRAYYDLAHDKIVLPHRSKFPSAAGYYQTSLHELGHWTGHPDRLNRKSLRQGIDRGFSSRAYAREELRAEICSVIMADQLEIGHDPKRSAAYVGSWAKALEDDHMEIDKAAKDAQKMSEYIIERCFEKVNDRLGFRDDIPPPEPLTLPPSIPPAPPAAPPPRPDPGEQLTLWQRAAGDRLPDQPGMLSPADRAQRARETRTR